MARKAAYSDKYSFYNSSVSFNLGGEPITKAQHGSLKTEGIDGAQPKRFTAERTKNPLESDCDMSPGRHCRKLPTGQPRNPLQPEYKLPTAPEVPYEPPKFVRDSMDSRPCVAPVGRDTRNLDASDIEGTNPTWKPHRLAKLASGDARTAHLDVSDITGPKPELTAERKVGPVPNEPSEAAKVGSIQNLEWKHQLYATKRQQATDVAGRREAAEAILNNLEPKAVDDLMTKLGPQLRALDRDHSGKLKPAEVSKAFKQTSSSVLTASQAKTIAEGLAIDGNTGLVDVRELVSGIYKRVNTSEAATGGASAPPKPAWMAAQERRVKTDVAVMLNQQPTSKLYNTDAIETPNEREMKVQQKQKKRVEGLVHAGEASKNHQAYWFANNAPQEGCEEGSGGGGGKNINALVGADGMSEAEKKYWFAETGEDETSLKEMSAWRPTKDAQLLNAGLKAKKENKNAMNSSSSAISSTGVTAGNNKAGNVTEQPKPMKSRADIRLEKQIGRDVAAVKLL